VIADGAEWRWNQTDLHFPGAIQIVHLYHTRQRPWGLTRKPHLNDDVNQKAWMKVHRERLLNKGKIEWWQPHFAPSIQPNPEVIEKIRIEADYSERNAERERYPGSASITSLL
jgi:hypothetical protein